MLSKPCIYYYVSSWVISRFPILMIRRREYGTVDREHWWMKVSHQLAEFDNRSHSKLRYVAVLTVKYYCKRNNRACKYICVSVYAYIMCVCMHAFACLYVCMYVYVWMYVCISVCMYVCMYEWFTFKLMQKLYMNVCIVGIHTYFM